MKKYIQNGRSEYEANSLSSAITLGIEFIKNAIQKQERLKS